MNNTYFACRFLKILFGQPQHVARVLTTLVSEAYNHPRVNSFPFSRLYTLFDQLHGQFIPLAHQLNIIVEQLPSQSIPFSSLLEGWSRAFGKRQNVKGHYWI